MLKQWVINASPIIALARINLAFLFFELAETIRIPSGVIEEINQGPDNDFAKAWINKHGIERSVTVGTISNKIVAWDLGKGETEVIQWACVHPGSTVILDDRAARNCAVSLGIHVMGTIGVILSAKKHNKLTAVKPILFDLDQNGFRICPELMRAALDIAKE